MSQSLSRILVHLVFSTKLRAPCLSAQIQHELHPYIGGTLNEHGCPVIEVGGVADHVHMLFGLSRTLTVAQIVERVKTSSSKWLKEKNTKLSTFQWQHGYGAFSVSQSDAERVITYIREQEQHHRKMTFQEEYRLLLKRYQVAFDERYVWD